MYTNYSLTTIRFFWDKNKNLFKPGPNSPSVKSRMCNLNTISIDPRKIFLWKQQWVFFVLLGADIKGESAGDGQAVASPPLRLHNRLPASLFHNIPHATKIKNRAAHWLKKHNLWQKGKASSNGSVWRKWAKICLQRDYPEQWGWFESKSTGEKKKITGHFKIRCLIMGFGLIRSMSL